VTGWEITRQERAWWQRRAAAELTTILDAYRDLPRIAWTVGPAGSVLAGQVNGLAPAAQVREVFTAWRLALALAEDPGQQMSGGTAWLHAAAGGWSRSGSQRRSSVMRSSSEPAGRAGGCGWSRCRGSRLAGSAGKADEHGPARVPRRCPP
jgi:hypothetical protein